MPYYYCPDCLKHYKPSCAEIELSNLKKEVHMCMHEYTKRKKKSMLKKT